MGKRKPIYITDRDDNGTLFGHLIAVTEDGLYRVDLPEHLTVLSSDGQRYEGADALVAINPPTEEEVDDGN